MKLADWNGQEVVEQNEWKYNTKGTNLYIVELYQIIEGDYIIILSFKVDKNIKNELSRYIYVYFFTMKAKHISLIFG